MVARNCNINRQLATIIGTEIGKQTVFGQNFWENFVENTQSVINTDILYEIYTNICKGRLCFHGQFLVNLPYLEFSEARVKGGDVNAWKKKNVELLCEPQNKVMSNW